MNHIVSLTKNKYNYNNYLQTLHEEIEAKKEDIEKLMSLNIVDDVFKSRMQSLIGESEKLWHEKMHLIEESLALVNETTLNYLCYLNIFKLLKRNLLLEGSTIQ